MTTSLNRWTSLDSASTTLTCRLFVRKMGNSAEWRERVKLSTTMERKLILDAAPVHCLKARRHLMSPRAWSCETFSDTRRKRVEVRTSPDWKGRYVCSRGRPTSWWRRHSSESAAGPSLSIIHPFQESITDVSANITRVAERAVNMCGVEEKKRKQTAAINPGDKKTMWREIQIIQNSLNTGNEIIREECAEAVLINAVGVSWSGPSSHVRFNTTNQCRGDDCIDYSNVLLTAEDPAEASRQRGRQQISRSPLSDAALTRRILENDNKNLWVWRMKEDLNDPRGLLPPSGYQMYYRCKPLKKGSFTRITVK